MNLESYWIWTEGLRSLYPPLCQMWIQGLLTTGSDWGKVSLVSRSHTGFSVPGQKTSLYEGDTRNTAYHLLQHKIQGVPVTPFLITAN